MIFCNRRLNKYGEFYATQISFILEPEHYWFHIECIRDPYVGLTEMGVKMSLAFSNDGLMGWNVDV